MAQDPVWGLGSETTEAQRNLRLRASQPMIPGAALGCAHLRPGVPTEGPGVGRVSQGTAMLRGQMPGNQEQQQRPRLAAGDAGGTPRPEAPETVEWGTSLEAGEDRRAASAPRAPPLPPKATFLP